MPTPSRWSDVPRQGASGYRLGEGPFWQGVAARGAWAHPKAVLALDFFNGRYMRLGLDVGCGSLISTTRSSTHLLADAAGTIRSFGPNELARLDGVGAYVGGQVTNRELRSQELDNAAWSRDNSILVTDAAVAPDGSATAEKLVAQTTSATHSVYKGSNSYAAGQIYVEDVYAKAGEHGWFQLTATDSLGTDKWANFHLSGAGAVGNKGSGCSAFIIRLANGWYWCGIVFTAPSAASGGKSIVLTNNADAATRGPSYAGDGSSGVFLWGAGSIASKFRAPPVTAGSAAATRYASDVRLADVSWLTGLAGGFTVLAAVNLSHVGDGVARRILNFSDGSAANELRLGLNSSGPFTLTAVAGGATQASLPLGPSPTPGRCKFAANFVAGAWYVVDSAGNQAMSASGAMPTALNELRIGQSQTGDGHFNDIIEQLQICQPLTQTEAQAWVTA